MSVYLPEVSEEFDFLDRHDAEKQKTHDLFYNLLTYVEIFYLHLYDIDNFKWATISLG